MDVLQLGMSITTHPSFGWKLPRLTMTDRLFSYGLIRIVLDVLLLTGHAISQNGVYNMLMVCQCATYHHDIFVFVKEPTSLTYTARQLGSKSC